MQYGAHTDPTDPLTYSRRRLFCCTVTTPAARGPQILPPNTPLTTRDARVRRV
jgi:hypothetical protein